MPNIIARRSDPSQENLCRDPRDSSEGGMLAMSSKGEGSACFPSSNIAHYGEVIPLPCILPTQCAIANTSLLRRSLRTSLLSDSSFSGNSSSGLSSSLLCLLRLRLLDASLLHRGLCCCVDSHCGCLVRVSGVGFDST